MHSVWLHSPWSIRQFFIWTIGSSVTLFVLHSTIHAWRFPFISWQTFFVGLHGSFLHSFTSKYSHVIVKLGWYDFSCSLSSWSSSNAGSDDATKIFVNKDLFYWVNRYALGQSQSTTHRKPSASKIQTKSSIAASFLLFLLFTLNFFFLLS